MSRNRYPRFFFLASLVFGLGCLCFRGLAGGGPLNTAILVNEGDPASLELGAYYAEVRGIPQRNMVRLTLPVSVEISPAALTNLVIQPLVDYLQAADILDQIDHVAIAWKYPYRISGGATSNEYNSITSALLYGFKSAPYPTPCNLTPEAASPVHEADAAFGRLRQTLGNTSFAATLLTGLSLASAKALVDRAVLADFTHPAGDIYFLHTSDLARNVQWPQFDAASMEIRMTAEPVQVIQKDQNKQGSVTNVAGYLAGFPNHRPEIETNGYTPGSFANHLTSFGGRIHDALGQMSILRWIEVGVTGAAGTVDEPCNYTNKFPSARVHLHSLRGYSLAESFLQAMESPYQTLVVGDPLCQPYATPPEMTITGATQGQTVSGIVSLSLSASSPQVDTRVGRVEWFMDGRHVDTALQQGLEPGNRIQVVLDGNTLQYTVATGDTLRNVAVGIAAEIRALPDFQAIAYNDRVEILQRDVGEPGASIPLTVTVVQNGAPRVGISAWPVFAHFVESDVFAREGLMLHGTVTAGDSLKTVITLADGTKTTNTVTAATSGPPHTLMNALAAAIQADVLLQGTNGCVLKYVSAPAATYAEGWLVANSPGYPGANLHVDYTIASSTLLLTDQFSDVFNDNADATVARNEIRLSKGEMTLSGTYLLDTTWMPDGPHVFSAQAVEGTAVESQGLSSLELRIDNHPGSVAFAWPGTSSFVVEGQIIEPWIIASSPAGIIETNLLVRGVVQSNLTVDTQGYGAQTIELQAMITDSLNRQTVSDPVFLTVLADSDHDGLPDTWERSHFGSIAAQNAAGDPDQDGQSNFTEFVAGTHPGTANLPLALSVEDVGNTQEFDLAFTANMNRRYTIEQADGALLPAGVWIPVSDIRFAPTNAVHRWHVPGSAMLPPDQRAFFRLKVDLP